MANITKSIAVGKGKGLTIAPTKRGNGTPPAPGMTRRPPNHTAGTKHAPGYY